MKLISIHNNVQHIQSRGCWLCIHIGLTAIFFHRPRLPKRWDDWQGMRIEINSGLRGRYRFSLR